MELFSWLCNVYCHPGGSCSTDSDCGTDLACYPYGGYCASDYSD